jgi:hypothetical protein
MLSECIKQIQQEGCYISQNYTGQLKKKKRAARHKKENPDGYDQIRR